MLAAKPHNLAFADRVVMNVLPMARIVLLALLLAACAGADRSTASSTENLPEKIISVSETIRVGPAETFDGGGALYDWIGPGDCSQNEGMPPMFELEAGATLHNLWMRNAPDGIHIRGSGVTIDTIVNVDVCEDAISISKGRSGEIHQNIVIENSMFFDCEDKAIQITRGRDILIRNNEFHSCAKPIRLKEQAYNIEITGNKIAGARTGIKTTGGLASASGNFFSDTAIAFWVEQGARLRVAGTNSFDDVVQIYKEDEGSELIFE